METATPLDPLDALRRLTPQDIDRRLDEIDSERAALVTIRRSIRARDRVRQRHDQQEASR